MPFCWFCHEAAQIPFRTSRGTEGPHRAGERYNLGSCREIPRYTGETAESFLKTFLITYSGNVHVIRAFYRAVKF